MKKWTKILCCFVLVGFMLVCGLAGCTNISDVKNTYADIIYNGTSAVRVEDYLYFGNAYSNSSSFTKDSDYVDATRNAYLARVNLTNLDAKNSYFSPKIVENIASEVISFDESKSFMFVLGQNIYYTAPNRKMMQNESGQSAYYFNYTAFFRCGLNGSGNTNIYTSTAEISQVEALKYDGKYYIVMRAGEDIIKIDLQTEKVTTLAENTTSMAIPKTYKKDFVGSSLDWNGQIYFTTARDSDSAITGTNIVKKISVAETDPDKAEQVYTQGNVTFLAREKDTLFFSESKENIDPAVFKLDVGKYTNKSAFLDGAAGKKETFYSGSTISDVTRIATTNVDYGYIFTTNSTLNYKTNNQKSGTISFVFNGSALSSYKTLCVTGRTIYLSTTTGIYRADISKAFNNGEKSVEVECQEVVSMTGISDKALYAFDGSNIYFYASLQTIPDELKDEDEDESDDETEETDDNLYLYRAHVSGNFGFDLLGYTTIDSRHTK